MSAKNQTKVIVEPGKQELFIIRDLRRRENWYSRHSPIQTFNQMARPRDLSMKIDKYESGNGGSGDSFTQIKMARV